MNFPEEMYLDMLEGAVKRLQGEIQQEEAEPEISLSMPALIPDDYISCSTLPEVSLLPLPEYGRQDKVL